MLMTITTTHSPASDLGYLLAKNPARAQRFSLAFGAAHVFYPVVEAERCTAALLLDVDIVGLTRRPGREHTTPLAPYVNDRAYVSSSFLSVAIAQVFSSALQGKSRERQSLAEQAIPLIVELPVVPCRGGDRFLRALFEPLGYVVEATRLETADVSALWSSSRYFKVALSITTPLHELLSHLYVLLPVLDDEKHYWVGDDEIDKLLRHGEGWLKAHPLKDEITHRYLRHQRYLTNAALDRLDGDDGVADEDGSDVVGDVVAEVPLPKREEAIEQKLNLNEQRLLAVVDEVKRAGATSVIDLGCGEGKLLRLLMKEKTLTTIVGVDVSTRALEVAAERLHLDEMSATKRARIALWQGTVTYRDARFRDHDVACLVEVIEHLEPSRLPAFEQVVFGAARVPTVIVTTPNVEFNATFEQPLPPGTFRHSDHRFEWTRAEFAAWADGVARRHGYVVRYEAIGTVDDVYGPPTQMAVFTRHDVVTTTGISSTEVPDEA